MALYQDGILISGANQLPQMTMAEYLAIPVGDRPTYWVCTDRDYDDLSAENVKMANGESVENEIEGEVIDLYQYLASGFTCGSSFRSLFKAYRMGSFIILQIAGVVATNAGNGQQMLDLPEGFFEGYFSQTIGTDVSSGTYYNIGVFVNGNDIYAHIPSGANGKPIWGQFMLKAGSYFNH